MNCIMLIVAVLVVLLVLLIPLYSMYVSLIQKKNKVKESMGGIDVQLKKRYDLIPNILVIANKFMEHEIYVLIEIQSLKN